MNIHDADSFEFETECRRLAEIDDEAKRHREIKEAAAKLKLTTKIVTKRVSTIRRAAETAAKAAEQVAKDAEREEKAARDAAEQATKNKTDDGDGKSEQAVKFDDFVAYMQSQDYIFKPSGDRWPANRINARLPPVVVGFDEIGKPVKVSASQWLASNAPVEQITWAPGLPQIIQHKLIIDGGWIERQNTTVFNLYRPPHIETGDPDKAGKWLDHIKLIYPDDAGHIVKFLAQRSQHPEIKINHALVLGGSQGIGKDSLLEPVKYTVGSWNFKEVSPQQMLGRFNGFVKAVILRVSEAKDMGEIDRFKFYDHMKVYTAAPPDVLRVDEKHLREYDIFNVCGVVMTTNHKTDGIYLPADDRRHYVAWSAAKKEDFAESYWTGLWDWYADGGSRHVAAYLKTLSLKDFNPKAPPPKTAAFWAIVDANLAPEDAEIADVLDKLGKPPAVTLQAIADAADWNGIGAWLRDRKNRRAIPHRMEQCGYVPVRNDASVSGLFVINKTRQVAYARSELSIREQILAVRELAKQSKQ